jgi:hypothetical protein
MIKIMFVLFTCSLSALTIDSLTIRYDEGDFSIFEKEWTEVQSPEQIAAKIASLQDASMAGVFAALSLAQLADRYAPPEQIVEAAELLRNARPMDGNLSDCIERVLKGMKECPCVYGGIIDAAEEIYDEFAMPITTTL